jgi:hypothetical protein
MKVRSDNGVYQKSVSSRNAPVKRSTNRCRTGRTLSFQSWITCRNSRQFSASCHASVRLRRV